MAEDRILPNLKTRLTLDSADIAKGREDAAGLRTSLAGVGQGAKEGGAQLQSGLISPLRVATDAAGVFAAKKIFDFGKAGFEELKGANVVTAQTANLLKNLGPAAGASIGDVEELSGAMLRQSGVDDELAQAAINSTLRLGVQGDQMKRVVQDANDLSQSFGDINSDAELLSQALAHPEKAARLLKTATGGLTDEQVKSIQAFQAQGDEASAQNVILDAVEAKVKGAAAAYGETLPGQVTIAQQSLANLKGELVANLAPALSFATQAEQFLVDEIDKLPDGAKAAVGGIGLVVAGAVSLARPVGDVVRLYQSWRERSEEVATAQEALATAELQEAGASAAGAASTASATAVTVASTTVTNESAAAAARRVVSNEQLVFSDAEIVAAEQARQAAELQSLVSNDALIAGDAALVAANEAMAASAAEYAAANGAAGAASLTAGSALVVAAAGAATAYGVYVALSDVWTENAMGVDEYTKALESNTGEQKSNTDAVTANKLEQSGAADIARAANVSFVDLFRGVRDGNEDWGAATRAIGNWGTETQIVPTTSREMAAALRDAGFGSSELGEQLIQAAENGKISGAEMNKLLHNLEGLHNGYVDATGEAAKHKEITDAVTAASSEASTGADAHRRSIDELRAATGDLTDSEKDELQVADDAAKAHEAFSGLINDLASAMDRSYQSTLSATNANIAYEGSVDDLITTLQGSLGKVGDLQDRVGDANQTVADSAQKVADEQAKLEHIQGDASTTANELARQQQRVSDAQHDHERSAKAAASAQKDLTAAMDSGTFTLDITTQKGRDNVKALEATGGAIANEIELRFQQTHSIDDAINTGAMYVTNLQEQLAAAGFNEDQIAEMIDTMNLTPDDIRTTFSNNAVEQQIVVQKYAASFKDIPEKENTYIEALIDQGKFDAANLALDNLAHGRSVYFTPEMNAPGYYAPDTDVPGRAAGGRVSANRPYVIGEKRAELFVPDQSGYVYPEVPGMWGSHGGGGVVQHFHVGDDVSAATKMMLRRDARQAAEDAIRELVPSGR